MNNKVRWIVFTAMMLALCVLFQFIRTLVPVLSTVPIFGPFNLSQLIVGALVNLTLIITTWYIGFWSGAAVSVLSTVIAFAQGQLPFPQMIIAVSAGNLILCLIVWLFRKPKLRLPGMVLASVVKPGLLWLLVTQIMVSFAPNEKVAANISVMFSWPQIITALIGGILALLIYPRLAAAKERA